MYKKVLSFCVCLCLLLCFWFIPNNAFAENATVKSDYNTTVNVTPLLTNTVIEGLTLVDGKYTAEIGKSYRINMTFQENNALEMDMDSYVYFDLPEGIVATAASGTIEIGVLDYNYIYHPIYHNYEIKEDKVIIYWNTSDPSFQEYLSGAHGVTFGFGISAVFDGSQSEVVFGTNNSTVVEVNNGGSVTVKKSVVDRDGNAVKLTEAQMKEMTFKLSGPENYEKVFSYYDMVNGTVTYSGLLPGNYTVSEVSKPDISNYTFNATLSTTSASAVLAPGQSTAIPLKNVYEKDKGSLELQKTVSGFGDNIPNDVKENITFTIVDKNGKIVKSLHYGQFKNGKYLLEGLDVGEYTIIEANGVTGYSCTYKVNGTTTDTPSCKVTIGKNKTATASFVNTYEPLTADLLIKKTVSGTNVPADTVFTVTSEKGYSKTFTYADMTEGADGKVYRLNDLPLGTYTVKENNGANVATYSLTVTGTGKVNLTVPDSEVTKVIHNEYTPVGSVEVKKTINIQGGTLSETLKESFRNKIAFEIFDSNNKKVGSLTYGDILDGKSTVSGLPVGTYTVKETASSITGYTLVSNTTQTKTVEVAHNKTSEASFTNTYEKDEYKLTLSKTFGDGSSYNGSNLPNSIKSKTTFTVKDASGKKVTLKDANGNAISNPVSYNSVVGGLDLYFDGPGPYTITESNPSVDGVEITTVVSAGGAYKTGTSTSIKLVNHSAGTVDFKNTYTQMAVIKGDKTIVGLNANQKTDVENKIKFTITRVDAESTPITVTLAQLKAGIEVPVGTYTVQENIDTAGVSGYATSVTVQVGADGAKINGAVSSEFEVEHNETVAVHFTNSYTIDGNNGLKVIKTVSGLEGVSSGSLDSNSDLYKAITFELQEKTSAGSWRVYGNYTLAQLSSGIDLPVGTYRIVEKNADVDGYNLDVKYRVGDGEWGVAPYEFNVTKDALVTVSVYNVYTQLGSLKLTKTISGLNASSLTSAEKNAIVFTVTHSSGTPTYTVKYSAFKNGSYTFNDIPVGTYTVTETASGTSTYNLVSTVCTSENGSVVVTGSDTAATIGYTNTYERKKGNLTITKTLVGVDASALSSEQKDAMVFTLKDQSGNAVRTVKYSEFINGSYTFNDLPTGKYSVSESVGAALTGSYTVQITGANKQVTVSENKTSTTEITNTFSAIGALELVKTFGSDLPAGVNIDFSIWRIEENEEENTLIKTVPFSDFTYNSETASYHYTQNKLAPGNYKVVEQDKTTGYKCTTTVKVGDGEFVNGTDAETSVVIGNTSSVAFKNTYVGDPSIKITKTIAGLNASEMTDEQKAAISFTVTNTEGYSYTFKYSDMNNGVMVLTDLKPGEYTVTETVSSDAFRGYTYATQYTIGKDTKNGTKAAFTAEHGEYSVGFTNTFTEIEPLNVEKDCIKEQSMLVTEEANYPIWRFTLTISNLNPNTTSGGTTTFTDVFDAQHSEWFRLATMEEVQLVFGASEQNAYIKAISDGDAPSAVFNVDNSEIVISGITENTAETCEFVYYLIVKDYNALEQLNSPKGDHTNGVNYDFRNVVRYRPMPYSDYESSSAEFNYEFTAVDKNIANLKDGKLVTTVNGKDMLVNYADYSVVLNEDEATIGNQSQIVAIDTFSENQTVLYDSIVTNPEVRFELDNTAHTIKFFIPNSTRVEVSYRSVIANSEINKVSLSNNIKLSGFIVDVEEVAERNVVGSGIAKIYAVKLFKVDSDYSNKQLEGVEFELYDAENGVKLTSGETGSNGSIIFSSWANDGQKDSLRPNHDYYLIEKTTVPGYNRICEPIRFRLSDEVGATPGPDENGVNILVVGGSNELIVKNDPVTATMRVTKSFDGWDNDESSDLSFKFALKNIDHKVLQTVTVTKDNPVAVFDPIHFTTVSDDDVKDGKTVTYYYYIQEVVGENDRVDGISYDTKNYPVTVTVSAGSQSGLKNVDVSYDGSESLVITNHESVEVPVTKVWDDNKNQDGFRSEVITVKLLADGEATDKTLVLNAANNWTGSFTDLLKFNGDEEIVYTIAEVDVPEGYTSAISGSAEDGFVITNHHTPETIDISGDKIWDDDNNRDGVRPEVITINLLKNGEVIDTKEVRESDEWHWDFTDLPKYENGQLIEYTILEEVVDNYGTEYDGNNVINHYTPDRTSVSVLKAWDDNDDQDGFRSADIIVELLANGKSTDQTLVLNASNNWTGTFTDLYEYEDGEKIVYTIKEVDVPEGYTSVISGTAEDGFVVTNHHTPETIDISGDKTWDDDNNRDGVRPSVITVNLLKNGEVIDTKEVSENDEWHWDFTDLPKYENGQLISYSITEESVEQYSTEYGDYNVTNRYTPGRTSINVVKSWDDNENQDGFRSEEIIVKLLANGEATDKTLVLNAANNWTGSFTDLYLFEEGKEIVYTIEEVEVPEGYTSEISGTAESGFVITNSHTPETTAVSGTKTWDDDNNRDGVRPEVIKIDLLKNGEIVDTKEVRESDEWSWSFTDLPKYENGQLIEYTILEEAVDNYGTEYDGNNVINHYTPGRTSVSVLKAWDDNDDQDGFRSADIIVALLANGEATDQTLVLNASNNWTGTFTDLYEYEDGEKIVYTIAEVDVPEGYTSVISGTAEDGFVVTNHHTPETIDISGDKTWDDDRNRDGVRPEVITINLLKNGQVFATKEVRESDDWSWNFTDLPKYENGQLISYSIVEESVEQYSTEYDGYNVINRYTPGRTSINVVKSWDDNENQDGFRSEEITVKLLANGEATDQTLVLNADNNWTGSFTDLYEYEEGKKIVYTVEEVDVPEGYTSEISSTEENGIVVTNHHTPETVTVSGTKTWDDEDNRDGVRPEVIKIDLLKNGEIVDTKEVRESDEWSWSFTDLPKYENGQLIEYTILEQAVENYSTEYDGFNVTNRYTPGKTSVSVVKSWNDNNNKDGKRPNEIIVTLLANGVSTDQTLVLNASNNWTGTFADLYVYEDGKKIVYTVAEVDVPRGYTSVIRGNAADGFVIVNTKPDDPKGPQTGDDSNIYLWIMLLIVSGCLLYWLCASRRRKA